MIIRGEEIIWLGHSAFLIKNSKIIYIDPYNISDENLPKADLILLTHGHYDHCSCDDIAKIAKDGTVIFATADCQSKLSRLKKAIDLAVVCADDEFAFGEVEIKVVPAYNLDKPFHSKEAGGVGYLIKMKDIIVYHAGDTDCIEEMHKLTGYQGGDKSFVALLPVGGRYTMCAEEAHEAVKMIKPMISIPMHYGSVAGTSEDAKEFVRLCHDSGFDARIMERH